MPRPPTVELIARGLLVMSNHILLCRSRAKGYCYLPGGHVEFGESAPAALARELFEETGQKVIVGDLLNVAEFTFKTKKRPHHELNLTFHIELAPPPARRGGPTMRSKLGPKLGSKSSTEASARLAAGRAFADLAGDRASGKRNAGAVGGPGDGKSGLPEIVSREKWIEFVWVGVSELGTLDVRPGPMAVWLAGEPWRAAAKRGRGRAGKAAGAGCREVSASWQGME